MALEAVPVRVRGEIVAGVGHKAGEVTIDEFIEKVRRRLMEVLVAVEVGDFVGVYLTCEPQAERQKPERSEDI